MTRMQTSRTLGVYVLFRVLPAFFAALFFFSLLFELIDLFSNLVKYIQNEADVKQVFHILALYLPRCVTMSLAPSMFFAAAYVFGSLKTSNELIVVHGSGISLIAFALPVILFAAFLSVAAFWYEDSVALPLYREKKSVSRALLGQNVSLNNAQIALLNRKSGVVWTADYFDDSEGVLSGVTTVRRSSDGSFIERIDARRATWSQDRWIFRDARRWSIDSSGSLVESFEANWESVFFVEPPASFRKGRKTLDDLSVAEALEYIRFLKSAGLPFRGGLAEYYERFTFALTPLVVTLLSIGAGGRLRKNILLSSLLISLGASTVFYVIRMISMLLARLDLVSPAAGAAAPVLVFLALGAVLFKTAHT